MEAAKAAYAKYVAELATLKQKKMAKFQRKFVKEHQGSAEGSESGHTLLSEALATHEKKLDATIQERLMQAKRKIFAKLRESDAGHGGDSFIAASAFEGSRPGYVFRKGGVGLGYYLDEPTQSRTVTTATPVQRGLQAPTTTDDGPHEYPYNPYAVLRKSEFLYHRAMKGKNRKKNLKETLAPSLSAGDKRGPAGVDDASKAAAAMNDWDGAAAGAAVAWDQLFANPSLPLVLDIGCGQVRNTFKLRLSELSCHDLMRSS